MSDFFLFLLKTVRSLCLVYVEVAEDSVVVRVLYVHVVELRVHGSRQHNILRPRIINNGAINKRFGSSFISGEVKGYWFVIEEFTFQGFGNTTFTDPRNKFITY